MDQDDKTPPTRKKESLITQMAKSSSFVMNGVTEKFEISHALNSAIKNEDLAGIR